MTVSKSRPGSRPGPVASAPGRRGSTVTTVTAVALVALLALAGCGSMEENPLGVNTPEQQARVADPVAGPAAPAPSGGEDAVPIGNDLGEDPLNVGLDGAELCGVQPKESRLRYTVMLHNPTLETFTFGDMALGEPEGLTIISSMVQTANREGHHHPAAPGAAHEEHTPTPAPSEEPEPIGPPVPAAGYRFVPDAHVNVIVTVELADGATHGSADNIVVAYAAPGREYAVPHDLSIDVDATSCS